MSDITHDKSLALVESYLPLGSLDAYIQRVNSIPMLTEEEEQKLSRKLLEDGDITAAQKLITAHLKYVVRVAKGYMGYGLMLGDLIQEGTVGLMKAVKRFEPDRGVRLVSFAVHWIRAEIHEFILKNWRIVKVATTKAQRKLFFKLRSSKKTLGWFNQSEIHQVAEDLGVKPEEVVRMEQRLHAHDASFDLPVSDEPHHALPAPSEYLSSADKDPMLFWEQQGWQSQMQDSFAEAFTELDERSQDILRSRWLNEEHKVTLQELAEKYGVSTERIRQLEKRAIEKLKQIMLPGESD